MIWPPYKGNLGWLEDRTILLVRHGSHAYGTNTPESDEDFKGVCIPPKEYYHGFMKKFEQAEGHDPDYAIYEVRKFFNLAADCNPSIIEVLWADESDVLECSKEFGGKQLMDNRSMFMSTKAKHTFSGYAIAQLKRIKTHRAWLLNPPTHAPTREEFGLPIHMKVTDSELGAYNALYGTDQEVLDKLSNDEAMASVSFVLPKEAITLFLKERQYRSARQRWSQYENWKSTRNEKRAAIEAKFGYDCKHGMHLVRLMRMCEEILKTGKVIVKRPDREELLYIRNGGWKYDDLLAWAEAQDAYLETLVKDSPLPKTPNREKLDELCQEIVESLV